MCAPKYIIANTKVKLSVDPVEMILITPVYLAIKTLLLNFGISSKSQVTIGNPAVYQLILTIGH